MLIFCVLAIPVVAVVGSLAVFQYRLRNRNNVDKYMKALRSNTIAIFSDGNSRRKSRASILVRKQSEKVKTIFKLGGNSGNNSDNNFTYCNRSFSWCFIIIWLPMFSRFSLSL